MELNVEAYIKEKGWAYEVFERDDEEPIPDDVLICCMCGKFFI